MAAGFELIRSDVVRKELAGLAETERGSPDLYESAHTERTYAACLARADAMLFEGKRVLLDATFRGAARRAGPWSSSRRRRRVPVLGVVCEARPETVRARLAARTGDASDATWETYLGQRGGWEPGDTTDTITVATDEGTRSAR